MRVHKCCIFSKITLAIEIRMTNMRFIYINVFWTIWQKIAWWCNIKCFLRFAKIDVFLWRDWRINHSRAMYGWIRVVECTADMQGMVYCTMVDDCLTPSGSYLCPVAVHVAVHVSGGWMHCGPMPLAARQSPSERVSHTQQAVHWTCW